MPVPPELFVVGRFPPPPDGQALATARCAAALEAAGFAVGRFNTEPPGPPPVEANPRLDLGRAAHYLRLRRRLRRALRAAPAAPVLWHAISPAPLGHLRDLATTLPALAPGQPVWGVLHRATFERLFASPLTAASARRLVRRVEGLVFQSARLAEACAPWVPPEKRRVIPNTIAEAVLCTEAEVHAKRAAASRRAAFHLLFLSHMLAEKGYADVLEATALLQARGVDVRATFAGAWPTPQDRAAFEARIAAAGLGGRVAVLGSVSDPATVKQLHLSADAFALPTYHPTETQPIAILEALNAATPVITVDRGITSDMLAPEGRSAVEGGGFLVPPRDPEAIAAAVGALTEPSAWTAASEAARSRFEATFAPALVNREWVALARALTRPPEW